MSATKERVLLIEPKNGYYAGFQGLVQTEPLGLEYVAGAVTDMVGEVRIHDARVSKIGVEDSLREFGPDIVGIRCNYTADVPVVRELAARIRKEVGKDVPIIVGGHHISLRPEDMFPQDMFPSDVTAVTVGPGEKPFQDIITALKDKGSIQGVPDICYQDEDGRVISNFGPRVISTRFKYQSEAMNARPTPRRDLVDKYREGYYFLYYTEPYSTETARGCRFRCSFCSVWKFHKGEYEVESSNRTVSEIASLPPNARYINIVDDLAFSDIASSEEVADELLRLGIKKRYWAQVRADNVWPQDPNKRLAHQRVFAKLAEAGLDMVLMGLESFDPAELKRVNKGSTVEQNVEAVKFLRSLGVRIWGAQIIFPNWTSEDFDKAIEINQRLGIECPQFTILTPLPGTSDYENARREGLLLTDDPGKFDFFHWVIPTTLEPEQLYREISRLYQNTGSLRLETIKDDIRAGRTTTAALRRFRDQFRTLSDENQHLTHLAQSPLTS